MSKNNELPKVPAPRITEARKKFAQVNEQLLQEQSRMFIEDILGSTLPFGAATKEGLHEMLKDGVVLCELIKKIDPLCLQQKLNNNPRTTMHSIENLRFFISACEGLGIKVQFNPLDFHEARNLSQFYSLMHSLAKLAKNRGFNLSFDPTSTTNESFGKLPGIQERRSQAGRNWGSRESSMSFEGEINNKITPTTATTTTTNITNQNNNNNNDLQSDKTLSIQLTEDFRNDRFVIRAAWPYSAQSSDELSFEKNQLIRIFSIVPDEAGWWRGELNGVRGLVPSTHVEFVKGSIEELSQMSELVNAAEEISRSSSFNNSSNDSQRSIDELDSLNSIQRPAKANGDLGIPLLATNEKKQANESNKISPFKKMCCSKFF
eukprot:TRINITY_DN800_c1_g1_i2.p1 TRINITY_DN800_c1_g1~~TRINITY_DN800_c1_g1_i2.p1  ORF type:complete len:401 (-),score=225.09 TRINITY_DN800_c1_g1_i2:186-1313(-)